MPAQKTSRDTKGPEHFQVTSQTLAISVLSCSYVKVQQMLLKAGFPVL